MGLKVNLFGIGLKDQNTNFINNLNLRLMGDTVIAYEKSDNAKKGLKDENEFWYRQSLMNLVVKFPPVDLFNWYKDNAKNVNVTQIKAFREWSVMTSKIPLSITEAERLYSGGWVKYKDYWGSGSSVSKTFKTVMPVVGSIVAGALAGGPVGAVGGAIVGTANYIKQGADEKNVMKAESKQLSEVLAVTAIEEQNKKAGIAAASSAPKSSFGFLPMLLIGLGVIVLFKSR